MPEPTLELESNGPVAWVWMNRPAVHNALNEAMIDELAETFLALGEDPAVRVIVLSGRGKSFSAGGDIDYMKRQGEARREENVATARGLAEMFHIVAELSPAHDRARKWCGHGRRLGPDRRLRYCARVEQCDLCGVGSAARADPFHHRTLRRARHRSATGEPAVRHGRTHRCGATRSESDWCTKWSRAGATGCARAGGVDNLLLGAPGAQSAAKSMIEAIADRPITREIMEQTAMAIADRRSDPEAIEGLSAFLEKRSPDWVPEK